MPANLENSAVAPGLEKVSFDSNLKEREPGESHGQRSLVKSTGLPRIRQDLVSHNNRVVRVVSCCKLLDLRS